MFDILPRKRRFVLDEIEERPLPGLCQYVDGGMMIGAGQPRGRRYINSYTDNTSQTTYTFSGVVDFGPEDPSRIIVIAIESDATSSRTLSSSSIAGSAGTTVVQVTSLSADKGVAALIRRSVPTGTTGQTVSVTFSGACNRCAIHVYALYQMASATPTGSTSSTATPPSSSLTPSADGVVIACAKSAQNTSCTWTGPTEDYDQVLNSTNDFTSASKQNCPNSSMTITATFVGTTSPAMVAAAWA